MPTEELALSPASLRKVMLPLSVQFLGRPWSEPLLLEIASAYERMRGGGRRPASDR